MARPISPVPTTAIFMGTSGYWKNLPFVLGDGVDQRRHAAFHRRDGAVESPGDIPRIFDRPLRVPAETTRDRGKIGRRIEDVHADIGALDRRTALARHG